MDKSRERRQQPRLKVGAGIECRLEVRSRVRMVDISASGALLATDLALPVASRATVHTTIADGPLSCAIEVRRQAQGAMPRQLPALGVVFTEMDERSRRSLEQFLKRASA
jgi:c-di-GMP-binding flagellar brake protein YcgR